MPCQRELKYRLAVCLAALGAFMFGSRDVWADEVLAAQLAHQQTEISMLSAKLEAVIEYLKWQAITFTMILLSSLGGLLNALYTGRKGRG